jgi:hypothetical protein
MAVIAAVPVASFFVWTVILFFAKNPFVMAAPAGIGSAVLSMYVTTGDPDALLPVVVGDPHAVSANAPIMMIATRVVRTSRRPRADRFDRDATFTTSPLGIHEVDQEFAPVL